MQRKKPKFPTIMIYAETHTPIANCPQCALIMYLDDYECSHCGFELTSQQKKTQQIFWRRKRKEGVLKGLIVFSLLLIALTCLFSWLK